MGKLTVLSCCLCFLPCLAGCAGSSSVQVTKNGVYFDTSISVTVEAENETIGQEVLNGCMELCQEMEEMFSRTSEDSELYQINHREENTVILSDELAEVIASGLEFYEVSGGKLDITIAPVLELWDFKGGTEQIPEEAELREALEKVDASTLDLSGNQLTFAREDTELDLGALAKGYAADRLKGYLQERGITHAVINLGGNVNTLGSRPDGSSWRVGIQEPFAERGTIARVLEVSDRSVVSSGTYERYFEKDGICYHHVLDPDTGYPADSGLSQVTIVSDESLTGDALSTICLLLGEEEGKKLLEAYPGTEAYFVEEN